MSKKDNFLWYERLFFSIFIASRERCVMVCLLVFFWLMPLGVDSVVASELSETEKLRVIELKGGEIRSWLRESVGSYSVSAVVNNRLVPIPFQFDEYDLNGLVYFEESESQINGKINLIDEEDRMLFMFADAGPRKSADMRAGGKIVAEVELTPASGKPRYVYVVKGSRLKSEDVYVRYAAALGRVETDGYTLTMSKKNALNWETFSFVGFSGDQESPIDTMKLRLRGGLGIPFPRVTLNNKHFVAKPYAEKAGPIRAITQMKVKLYLFKIPLISFDIQAHFDPHRINYTARVQMKWWQRAALWDPKLTISLDCNKLRGLEVESSVKPGLVAIADMKESNDEKTMQAGLFDEGPKWIWAKTGMDMDLFARFYFVDGELPLSFYFYDNDDKKDRPERFVGQSPNIGYRIESIPKEGFIGLSVGFYISNNLGSGPGEALYSGLTSRLNRVVRQM